MTPLLTHDLVIAARDRAREPELPEATLARALSTPISPRLARYDVIIVSDAPGDDRETRIAAEFARHEHRVFHLGEHDLRQATRGANALPHRRAPGTIRFYSSIHSPPSASQKRSRPPFFSLPRRSMPRLAREVRSRWGWRIVASSDAPVSAAG